MKREKQLTKRERKAAKGAGPSGSNPKEAQHIHCIACGRHIEPSEFNAPATAMRIEPIRNGGKPSSPMRIAR